MSRTFRMSRYFRLPAFLLDDEAGGAFAWALAALVDVSVEHVRQAVYARMPSFCGPSGLARIGRSRLISRGRSESDLHYAARLRAWRYPRGHRVRGVVFGLLEQISEYFGGLRLWGIDAKWHRRERSATGELSYAYGAPWVWDSVEGWARQWLVLDATASELGPEGVWGADSCIGIRGSTPDDWAAVRALCHGQHRWLPAGTRGEWLIVLLSGDEPVPDTSWAKWGKLEGETYVPARASNCRYVVLRDAIRDYAGDNDFAVYFTTGLGTWSGIADFPAYITLPIGGSTPGIADFPATITLPDDGDIPQ
jgi:hypothetical protein